jgi:hypothetical protein
LNVAVDDQLVEINADFGSATCACRCLQTLCNGISALEHEVTGVVDSEPVVVSLNSEKDRSVLALCPRQISPITFPSRSLCAMIPPIENDTA